MILFIKTRLNVGSQSSSENIDWKLKPNLTLYGLSVLIGTIIIMATQLTKLLITDNHSNSSLLSFCLNLKLVCGVMVCGLTKKIMISEDGETLSHRRQ